MDDSDSSALSEHSDKEIQKLAPVFLKAKAASKLKYPPPKASPPRPKREPSPPHEVVLADNPDIAFLVLFRSRFNEAMPPKLATFGPQDIERGVQDPYPSPEVSQLMCALLALVLNRKKPVERGHHGRALEEAVLSHKKEWPRSWNEANPLHGGKNFENMAPSERLNLLRTLVMWALDHSEAIQTIIKDKYKQQRHSDDENQPLSVQPWGSDGDKRRYFLVQGLDDTSFRVYREGDRYKKTAQWYSVAGSIDEVKALAKKLEDTDGSQAARRLAGKMMNAIPTFEASEEKRRRREYRQIRRAAFSRPEPGFSLYEGRTRGKRMRYTYDDDDDNFLSDETSTRRSARQSGRNSPFDSGPTVTASGRQVRQPRTGDYGESLLSGPPISTDELAPDYSDVDAARSRAGTEDSEEPVRGSANRATRSAGRAVPNGNSRKRKHIDTYNSIDEMSEEEEEMGASADEWDSDKNDNEDVEMPDADDEEEMSGADDEDSAAGDDGEPQSLLLKLKVPTHALSTLNMSRTASPAAEGATQAAAPPEREVNGAPPPARSSAVNNQQQQQQSLQQQPGSSPMGPSAYPTPTSTSFLPKAEQKVVSAVALPAVALSTQAQSGPLRLPDEAVSHRLPNGDAAMHDVQE